MSTAQGSSTTHVPSHHGKTTPTKCTKNPGKGALCICLSMDAAKAAWSPIEPGKPVEENVCAQSEAQKHVAISPLVK